jgi:SAM-dependent methyltransferase
VSVPSFTDQREAWQRVPVDDEGYLPVSDLLAYNDDQLLELARRMERTRYGGWRNHEGRWRTALGLDDTHGKTVLDYGCGVGIEALQYAKAGNQVVVADISRRTIKLARRVLRLFGHEPLITAEIRDHAHLLPTFADDAFDVIHCAGVLHHIPDPRPTMELFHRLLKAEGELRLMVYGPQAWQAAIGTPPPDDVAADPGFARYVGAMDAVGAWADWYDRDRLEARFGDLFTIRRLEHLTPDGRYLAAILIPRKGAA